jgi:hypothetical protein
VERNVTIGNTTYIQRTTVVNQRFTTTTFVTYKYGGVVLTRFVTPVFYAPAFYGWAYYPWVAPIHFGFAWVGSSWYVGPSPYFAVYPSYPSSAFWLTDFLLGETLATAYQLHQDALLDRKDKQELTDATAVDDDSNQAQWLHADVTTPVTSDLKDAIAEEVKQQLAYDNAAAANPTHEVSYEELPAALGHANHLFIASGNLDVTTTDQQECELQPGDILQLNSHVSSDAVVVPLRVVSSQRMDCPVGVLVNVSLQDLQDMQNNFHWQVESGLGTLQAKQGHDGIPVAAPEVASAPPRPALINADPITPTELTTMIDVQRQEADQVEAQAVATAF